MLYHDFKRSESVYGVIRQIAWNKAVELPATCDTMEMKHEQAPGRTETEGVTGP
jgi:hypothetical protein